MIWTLAVWVLGGTALTVMAYGAASTWALAEDAPYRGAAAFGGAGAALALVLWLLVSLTLLLVFVRIGAG